jgi:ABC-type branched-subunit amino acid transport system substrate-binding protein
MSHAWSAIGRTALILFALLLTGCAGTPIQRVALLAPFEGRYREVGYDAYYAAQLAMQDFGSPTIELLAIDDGGSSTSAVLRARALVSDPLVNIVIALGYAATADETLAAFAELPVIVVGDWGARPVTDTVLILSNPDITTRITAPRDVTAAASSPAPLIGGEALALRQFRKLRADLMGIEVVSSARIADPDFHERFVNSGPFVPEPGLLATLNYDATALVLRAMQTGDVATALTQIEYKGLNGLIRFDDGYWAQAPLNIYQYNAEGLLEPIR